MPASTAAPARAVGAGRDPGARSHFGNLLRALLVLVLSVAFALLGTFGLTWLSTRLGWCCFNTWALSRGTLGPVVLGCGLLGYHGVRALGAAFGTGRRARFGLLPHAAYVAAALAVWPPTERALWVALPLALLATGSWLAGRRVRPVGLAVVALGVAGVALFQRVQGEGPPSRWLYVADARPSRECPPEPTLELAMRRGVLGQEMWQAPRLFHGFYGHQTVLLRRFLEAGDDPNICGPSGLSPLAMAATIGRENAIELLLARGADIEFSGRGELGSPLLVALSMGRWRAAQLLLARGANVAATGSQGGTALHEAALGLQTTPEQERRVVMARELLDRGVKVDARSRDGTTALALAAAMGHRDLVALLLERGADPSLRTGKAQLTAEDRARKAGHVEVAGLLAAQRPRRTAAGGVSATERARDSGRQAATAPARDRRPASAAAAR